MTERQAATESNRDQEDPETSPPQSLPANAIPTLTARRRLDLRGSEGPSKILRMAQNWTFGASLHRPPQSQETSAIACRL